MIESTKEQQTPVVRFPAPTVPPPALETLIEMIEEGGCEATDGCYVEADGTCPHGHRSWALVYALI